MSVAAAAFVRALDSQRGARNDNAAFAFKGDGLIKALDGVEFLRRFGGHEGP